VTWSKAQQFAIPPDSIRGARGGKAGILVWTFDDTAMKFVARVWQNGTWSAPSPGIGNSTNNNGCDGVVGDSDALIVCTGTTLEAARFANGAWTTIPTNAPFYQATKPGRPLPWSVATDGADYRVDYMTDKGNFASILLHGGAWSTPMESSALAGSQPYFTASLCGGWSMVSMSSSFAGTLQGAPGWSVSDAIGSAAYPAGRAATAAWPSSWPYFYRVMRGPNELDSIYVAPLSASNDSSVLWVDFGL
jgi:hypothetical protein